MQASELGRAGHHGWPRPTELRLWLGWRRHSVPPPRRRLIPTLLCLAAPRAMGVVMVAAAGASHPAAADPPCRPGEAVGRLRSLGGCWLLAGCCCCCCCCCCSACSACCSAQPSCARALGRVATHGGDDSCRAGMGGGAAKQQTPGHGAPSTAQALDARRSTLDARRSTLESHGAQGTGHGKRGRAQGRSALYSAHSLRTCLQEHTDICIFPARPTAALCIYTYGYVYIYSCAHAHTHTHARMQACMHVRIHACARPPTPARTSPRARRTRRD